MRGGIMPNEDVLLTTEEKDAIKENAPDKMPLNPSAQGWSGAAIRKRLSKALVNNEGSLLSTMVEKFELVKQKFDDLDGVDSGLDDRLTTTEGQISALQTNDNDQDALIQALQNDKLNASTYDSFIENFDLDGDV